VFLIHKNFISERSFGQSKSSETVYAAHFILNNSSVNVELTGLIQNFLGNWVLKVRTSMIS
jgi:hypothetical protein